MAELKDVIDTKKFKITDELTREQKGNLEGYPSLRQRSAYDVEAYTETSFQQATNAAAYVFRRVLKTLTFIFAFFAFTGLMETIQRKIIYFGDKYTQFSSLGYSVLIFSLGLAFSFGFYQIYLIFGHGYKDRSAQLLVDKYSTKKDCAVVMSLIRGFYLFAIVISLSSIAINWFFYDFSSQWFYLKDAIEVTMLKIHIDQGLIAGSGLEYTKRLVMFPWLVSLIGGFALIVSLLGFVNYLIQRSKLTVLGVGGLK